MVRAVFRPEAELTLLLRMRTKEIVKTAGGALNSSRSVTDSGAWYHQAIS